MGLESRLQRFTPQKTIQLFLLIFFAISCLGDKGEVQTLQNTRTNTSGSTPMRWSSSTVTSVLSLKSSQSIEDTFVGGDYSMIDGVNHSPNDLMMREWNQTISGTTFFEVPSTIVTNKEFTSLSSYFDGEMGIYYHSTWFDNVSSSALAITQFFGVRRNADTVNEYIELSHADIIFNFSDFSFSTDPSDATSYDYHSVLLHELGHFLGLNHTSTGPSVMLPFLGISDSNRAPKAADITNITHNYTVVGASGLVSAAVIAPSPNEGQTVRGLIELRSNGECIHHLNDEIVHSHHIYLTQPIAISSH